MTREKRGSPSRPLPGRLLDVDVTENAVVPRYLTGTHGLSMADAVLSCLRACQGRRHVDVEVALEQGRPGGVRRAAWRALAHLLQGQCGYVSRSDIQPVVLREAVFEAAAASGTIYASEAARGALLRQVADGFALSASELEHSLYADVAGERRLGPLPAGLSPSDVVDHYNLALGQGLLLRSEWARVRAEAQLAPVLRNARRQRLMCLVEQAAGGRRSAVSDGAWHISLSGPLSLFHHTTRYGRAMAGWLPVLVRAPGWELDACCNLRSIGRRRFRADHRGPISAVERLPLRPFDSTLEGRFARDLRREAGERLLVLREADPLQIGGHVVCPDFTIVDQQTRIRVGVELVGFWTPSYLERKLELLRRVGARWVVCIDEALAAGREEQLPPGPVFRFRRRVNIRAFLQFLHEKHL